MVAKRVKTAKQQSVKKVAKKALKKQGSMAVRQAKRVGGKVLEEMKNDAKSFIKKKIVGRLAEGAKAYLV